MKNTNKRQYSPAPKFVMTITIILMVGTLLGAVGYLITKIPCSCMTGNKEFKKIAKDDVNNWKVYSDEKYNFQVRYPADISDPIISENENAGKKELQKEINFNINDDLEISISIWNMEASEKDDLAEAKEKYNEVSINGNYGWQSKQDYNAANENKDPSAAYSFETYFYSKTHIYQIEYKGIYNAENFDLYQKIVSNFEIGEDETANWQTYRNEEYGFEAKYPNDWMYEQNVFLSGSNLVFCPQKLTEVVSERIICKWKKEATKSQYEIGMIYLFNYASDSKPNNPDYRYLGVNNSGYYYLYSSLNSNESIVDQILSTFKFIEKDETKKVKLYYYNKNYDPKFDCLAEAVMPVEREMPKTDTLIQDTINLLIKGEITEQEKLAGFSSEFPNSEFKLLGATLDNKVLTLNFTEVPSFTTGGTCRIGLLAAQITKTAKQFEGVKEVKFSPNELFQP